MITLQIQQKFGRLGLDITPFKYDLNIKAPDLDVKQTPAQISLDQIPLQIDIDYTAAKESIGYYALTRFMKIHAEEGLRAAIEGVARRAQEGDALGDIEKGISIGQVADQRYAMREVEVQLAKIAPLEYSVAPGRVNWHVEPGGVEVFLQRGALNATFEYGKVKTYLEQEPSIQIKAIGSLIDVKK